MKIECRLCGALTDKRFCGECGAVVRETDTTLSRRNLIHLLARLEDGEVHPHLFKQDGTVITAESDSDHYLDYQPGGLGDSEQTFHEISLFLNLRRL